MTTVHLTFPEGAAVCAAGDYLIRREADKSWRAYRVEDLLAVQRLVPIQTDPSSLMVEEHLLDSMAPAYFNEVQLLLTAFEPAFADEAGASRAIDNQTLTERETGLLRSARAFTPTSCRVVRRPEAP